MLASFKRGVHPPHSETSYKIEKHSTSKVIMPVQQHIGGPCEPLVKVGDNVKRYQMIADSKAPCSAPVHAAISGKVVDISPHPSPNGQDVLSVVIEGSGEEDKALTMQKNAGTLKAEKLLERIRSAGIVGMGGAGFPTHIKLKPDKKIDTLVINGAECEPFIRADNQLMIEHAKDIAKGVNVIRKILKPKKVVVGIEQNKPDAIRAMEDTGLGVAPLKTKYPQGAEKILIKTLTGRGCAHTTLPSEVGVVVSNVATAFAVYEAAYFEKPLVERVVTVAGKVRHPKNLLVPIGTPVSEIIKTCGPRKHEMLVMGGPMMGIAQYTDNIPITKTSNAVLLMDHPPKPEMHCIRCGRCVDVCPYGLLPTSIAKAAEHGHWGLAEKLHVMECMECGCCSYACPSGIPLVQHIRVAKAKLLEQKRCEQ